MHKILPGGLIITEEEEIFGTKVAWGIGIGIYLFLLVLGQIVTLAKTLA